MIIHLAEEASEVPRATTNPRLLVSSETWRAEGLPARHLAPFLCLVRVLWVSKVFLHQFAGMELTTLRARALSQRGVLDIIEH